MQTAVFIDRDGVINRNPPNYVKTWEEFLFFAGVLPALNRMSSLPWPIVIVTNQSVVGRGILTGRALEDIHARMLEEIEKAGGRVDGLYVCPHHPDEGCDCRKPQPGLLLRAAGEMDIDLPGSVFLGDSHSDVLAAVRAGVQPVFRLTEGDEIRPSDIGWRSPPIQVPVVRDLLEFSNLLTEVAAEGKRPADMIYYLAARITLSGS